ncbi:MAG: S1C family serine protease [Rhodospirillales bacterium]
MTIRSGTTRCRAAAALVVILGALVIAGSQPGAAASFPTEVMASVVSLLPDWPGFSSGGRGADGRPKNPEGTAVAVLPGGYLATNVHVIGRAETIRIRLEDGRIMPAEIVGRDPLTDIALVKAPMDLPVPPVGPEPGLGDRVCAIGNQFGLGLSVTCGVVSALHRTGTGFNSIEDFIQTDAVVNPGGSGGLLVDGGGRMVGLVSAIFTKDSDANIGVNFASSITLVLRVVRDLKDHGRVLRGELGFGVRDLTENERRTLSGAAIDRVARGGPALEAGLEVGDVVTAVGDRPIRRASDLPSAAHMNRPGQAFSITIVRAGVRRQITLTPAP